MGEIIEVKTSSGVKYVRYDWALGAYADCTADVLAMRAGKKGGRRRR